METVFNYLLLYYLLNTILEDNKNIIDKIIAIIENYKNTNKHKKLLRNFMTIICHKRQYKNDEININSKNIFYNTIVELYEYYPIYINNLIIFDIFSNYGYYKDYLKIWEIIYSKIKSENDIDIIFKKYNNLILNISYILVKTKNEDMNNLDFFIKQFSKYNSIYSMGYKYIINNNLDVIHNFMNLYNTDYYCNLQNIKKIEITNVAKWLPRENKSESKKIFWYRKINDKYIKFNCYDYLILVDKILFKGKSDYKISSLEKKIFRKESSLLNICLNNPNIFLCEKRRELLNFYKCGSKFIYKNHKSLLYKDNNKNIKELQNIYSNMKDNINKLYKFNNIHIYKYNLLHYLNTNFKNKKNINKLLLDYDLNVGNYEDNLENMLNDIYKIPEYVFIPFF